MAGRVPFALVDVFADVPLAGNPLAVVPDADQLSDDLFPRIAREFNQAETTFLLRPTRPGAHWRLRSFTAEGQEVYGAGHNALGAWWWLAEQGRLAGPDGEQTWWQEIGPAVLPVLVTMADGRPARIAMRQQPAEYGRELTDLDGLARALQVDRDSLGAAADLPVAQVVSTGAAHLLVGLSGRAVADAAGQDRQVLKDLLLDVGGVGICLYALDPAEPAADAHARFFNPVAGIVEDPATGTAAGALASLLARYGRAGDRVTIVQGHVMGRPSRIVISLADAPTIEGRATLSATGELRLP
jgi:trans-2,3-dihydro-3-hydroxyanthranilate isomerase